MPSAPGGYRVAVLLPCRNEEASVGVVVRAFREALPGAQVYVYVNASTDRTAEEAAAAGAVVRSEDLPGKGNVVRRMFADVEADVYVIADGDGTYEAAAAPALIERLVAGNLDMAVGVRAGESGQVWRRGHRLGNALISTLVNAGSGSRYTDAYSGYRALSRRLVKSFPAASRGFEIELELAMHCARLRLPCAELPTRFAERSGGESKLRTWRDGARALLAIGLLAGEAHPLRFFAPAGLACALLALALAAPSLRTYVETGVATRLPALVLAVGLGLAGGGSVLAGAILDSAGRGRREAKRLAYLRYPSVLESGGSAPPDG